MRHSRRAAFTLMELMTVMIIIGILTVMVMSSIAAIKQKAARGKCVNNIKSLYTAAQAYLTDHESWPQIEAADPEDAEFAKQWITALTPYTLNSVNWVCPSVDEALGKPAKDPNKPRLDYFPTEFGVGINVPHIYSTHPWFMERADVHGNGNLIILANGQVYALKELAPKK